MSGEYLRQVERAGCSQGEGQLLAGPCTRAEVVECRSGKPLSHCVWIDILGRDPEPWVYRSGVPPLVAVIEPSHRVRQGADQVFSWNGPIACHSGGCGSQVLSVMKPMRRGELVSISPHKT